MDQSVFLQLADHLSRLGMGYPVAEVLLEMLEDTLTLTEAKVALAIPTGVIPLQTASVNEIRKGISLPRLELEAVLDRLVENGFLFTGPSPEGGKGYALQQVGFGFPQAHFWKGEDTPHARKMAGFVARYFNRKMLASVYGTDTKPYRYIPVGRSLDPDQQAVYPLHMMERVIEMARRFALAHCPCRIGYKLLGRSCEHPTEVCMKFDEMADYVIERGLAREINKDEAYEVIRKSEEAGLVHFVDNAKGGIKHSCNCCGCACWNVGNIRRRKIPRDILMAVYFLRITNEEECIGCGACLEICPVDCLKMVEGFPVVDENWCIGCGVCHTVCPTGAVGLKTRLDKSMDFPSKDFAGLHKQILEEKSG